jgi:two-component system cell cycle response regulator DivK
MSKKEYNWTGKVILIAEDSETSRHYFLAALKRTGATLIWARTGMEAIEMVRTHHPDLVFMDLDLPVMNGIMASRLIHEEFPSLPIVAQTAHIQSGDARASFEAGCSEFMTKPISLDFLLQTLDKYLQ